MVKDENWSNMKDVTIFSQGFGCLINHGPTKSSRSEYCKDFNSDVLYQRFRTLLFRKDRDYQSLFHSPETEKHHFCGPIRN